MQVRNRLENTNIMTVQGPAAGNMVQPSMKIEMDGGTSGAEAVSERQEFEVLQALVKEVKELKDECSHLRNEMKIISAENKCIMKELADQCGPDAISDILPINTDVAKDENEKNMDQGTSRAKSVSTMDEVELKKERRKQSNRESARRSRLRKKLQRMQAEAKKLEEPTPRSRRRKKACTTVHH